MDEIEEFMAASAAVAYALFAPVFREIGRALAALADRQREVSSAIEAEQAQGDGQEVARQIQPEYLPKPAEARRESGAEAEQDADAGAELD